MKGRELIHSRIVDLVNNKYKEHQVIELENGFHILIPNFPYVFKVICYEEIGWNVYLEFIEKEVLVEHPPTDSLYVEMENIVDEINYSHFGLDENLKPTIEQNFKQLDNVLELYSEDILKVEKNDLNYRIVFNIVENTTPSILVKYSIAMNKWNVEFKNFFKDNNVHDRLFETFTNMNLLVEGFNRQIDSLNYYF